MPTVGPGATIADVRAAGPLRFPVPVVSNDGVLIGTIDPAAAALPPDTVVERTMVPAPGTIRPELRVEEVAERLDRDGLDHILVTAVDGTLVGLIVTAELHV